MLGITIEKVKRVTSRRYDEMLKRQEDRKRTEDEFVLLVKKYLPISNSLNNLCMNLGLRGVDGYYKKIKRIIEENNLSTEHFGTIKLTPNGSSRNKYTAMDDDEFFSENSNRNGDSTIKRLINGHYKEYRCENPNCGISDWNGQPIKLEIHHINGDHYDNRLENLQLLCPNCHSQTDTYARRNINRKGLHTVKDFEKLNASVESINLKETKHCQVCGKEISGCGKKYCSPECAQKDSRKFEVTKEQLIDDFKGLKTFRGVGRKYNVTDNAIRKRCKKLGILDEIKILLKEDN